MVTPPTTAEKAVQAIKGEMERQSLSVLELADRSLIPRSTLQRRLEGVSAFSVEELDRIAGALSVDVLSLVNGSAA